MVPRTGRLVLPAPSRERLSCPQMLMSGGFTPTTTLGLLVPGFPLAAVPVPKCPTKGWLRERSWVLPQRPGSHSVPSSPYEDIIRGLRSEPLHQKARRPDNWCQSVDPLMMSIFTPRAMQVAPSQDPATLCSTVTSPQQLDQGPIIRKLSRDGNEEQILHLILANYCTQLQSTS